MSKYDCPTQFECQNRILNIKIAFSDSVRMSKYDFECQNTIFQLSSNVKVAFLKVKIAFSDSVRTSK